MEKMKKRTMTLFAPPSRPAIEGLFSAARRLRASCSGSYFVALAASSFARAVT
jgi:hypothetical protein